MDKGTGLREEVWRLHHSGQSISQIAAKTGLMPSFVRREILLRWAYDEGAPEGVNNGRDKHDSDQYEPSAGEWRA